MNVERRPRRHMVDFLFALALFCVFAATALMVVLIGARVYKNTVDGMEVNFERRTSLSYVATKLRQFDREGAITVGTCGDQPAIVMTQEFSGNVYQTLVYHLDGTLRELSVREGVDPIPENGSVVMEVDRFSFEQPEPGLFRLISTDQDGNPAEIIVSTQCGQGE